MLNTVILMGRLTADPELRHTPTNVPVTRFTLAVNRDYVKQGAERVTDFIDIVAWRSTAEFVNKYFHKGQLVAVQGSLQTRTYTDRDGNNRKVFEVVADNVYFAEPRRDNSSPRFENDDYSDSRVESEPVPSYTNADTGDFEILQDEDNLPF